MPIPAARVFITGTDTDVGKTWLVAALVRAYLERGIHAKALKPVACGLDDAAKNGDIEALLSAQRLSRADQINCYRFALPVAPSQAALSTGELVDTDRLVQWSHDQLADAEIGLIEGVGGLMTPITENWLVSDWIEAMPDYAVWLVVACKLGAINQSLLTLEKLKQMQRFPTRIFFNAVSSENNAWIAPTRQAVEPFLPADCCTVCSLTFDADMAAELFPAQR